THLRDRAMRVVAGVQPHRARDLNSLRPVVERAPARARVGLHADSHRVARLDLRRVERGGEPALQVAVAPGLRANVRRRSVAGPVVLGGGDNLAWPARGLSAVPLDV